MRQGIFRDAKLHLICNYCAKQFEGGEEAVKIDLRTITNDTHDHEHFQQGGLFHRECFHEKFGEWN